MKNSKNTQVYPVLEESRHERLDVFLVEQMAISRSQIQKMITLGQVTIDGKIPKKAGERLTSAKNVEVEALAEKFEASKKTDRKKMKLEI